jgi:hypothetical protein
VKVYIITLVKNLNYIIYYIYVFTFKTRVFNKLSNNNNNSNSNNNDKMFNFQTDNPFQTAAMTANPFAIVNTNTISNNAFSIPNNNNNNNTNNNWFSNSNNQNNQNNNQNNQNTNRLFVTTKQTNTRTDLPKSLINLPPIETLSQERFNKIAPEDIQFLTPEQKATYEMRHMKDCPAC